MSDLRNGMKVEAMVEKYGRTPASVYQMRHKSGIVMSKPSSESKSKFWSDAELADLMAGKLTNAEMSRKYGRPLSAVRQKRSKMGLLVGRTKAARSSSQKFPSKPVTPPGCSYCSGHKENPCTCADGDKCRDVDCLYYVGRGRKVK